MASLIVGVVCDLESFNERCWSYRALPNVGVFHLDVPPGVSDPNRVDVLIKQIGNGLKSQLNTNNFERLGIFFGLTASPLVVVVLGGPYTRGPAALSELEFRGFSTKSKGMNWEWFGAGAEKSFEGLDLFNSIQEEVRHLSRIERYSEGVRWQPFAGFVRRSLAWAMKPIILWLCKGLVWLLFLWWTYAGLASIWSTAKAWLCPTAPPRFRIVTWVAEGSSGPRVGLEVFNCTSGERFDVRVVQPSIYVSEVLEEHPWLHGREGLDFGVAEEDLRDICGPFQVVAKSGEERCAMHVDVGAADPARPVYFGVSLAGVNGWVKWSRVDFRRNRLHPVRVVIPEP